MWAVHRPQNHLHKDELGPQVVVDEVGRRLPERGGGDAIGSVLVGLQAELEEARQVVGYCEGHGGREEEPLSREAPARRRDRERRTLRANVRYYYW